MFQQNTSSKLVYSCMLDDNSLIQTNKLETYTFPRTRIKMLSVVEGYITSQNNNHNWLVEIYLNINRLDLFAYAVFSKATMSTCNQTSCDCHTTIYSFYRKRWGDVSSLFPASIDWNWYTWALNDIKILWTLKWEIDCFEQAPKGLKAEHSHLKKFSNSHYNLPNLPTHTINKYHDSFIRTYLEPNLLS
jgi:hypothetical protein